MDERTAIGRAGMDQVRELFSLHYADIFQRGDGVISSE
jgi:hypothetical protein